MYGGIGRQTPFLLRFLDACLQNPEGAESVLSRLGRIVATTAPGNRRIQREVAVNAPGLRPAASETGLRSSQPYLYIAEAERFYRKTRVFCMQVNPVTETTDIRRSISIVANGRRAECREVGRTPAAAECLDQKHTRVQPPPLDIDIVSLVGEFDRLRGDHLEVRVDAAPVTIRKNLKGVLR